MGRYSLWLINKKSHSEDKIIPFPCYDKNNTLKLQEKVDLMVIDHFTTTYKDKANLIYEIKNTDKINTDDYELVISYQSSKKTKHLDVAYFDDTIIKNFSHLYSGEKFLPSNDKDLIAIKNFILNTAKDSNEFSSNGKIYRDIMNSSYLNDYMREKIQTYVYARSGSAQDENDRQFAQAKLLEELSRYKNIRGITFFLKKYKSKMPSLNVPEISDRTNIKSKYYEGQIIDDDLTEMNSIAEEELNYKDPYQRNYDENEEELDFTDINSGNSDSKGKTYSKSRVPGSSHGQVPGQFTFYDN